jgi:hypothetical protein
MVAKISSETIPKLNMQHSSESRPGNAIFSHLRPLSDAKVAEVP